MFLDGSADARIGWARVGRRERGALSSQMLNVSLFPT